MYVLYKVKMKTLSNSVLTLVAVFALSVVFGCWFLGLGIGFGLGLGWIWVRARVKIRVGFGLDLG